MGLPKKKENIYNLPNLLSFYRLIIFPVILYFAISNNERPFAILICISLMTDALDGIIARKLNLVTKLGGQLDSLADLGTFILAVYGGFKFKWVEIQPHAMLMYIALGVFLLSYFIGWIRFRKTPGLHLYSCATAGYLMGFFIFVLFAFGFYPWFYYVALIWVIIAFTEKIIVLFCIDEIAPGNKGLYWILKKKLAMNQNNHTDLES